MKKYINPLTITYEAKKVTIPLPDPYVIKHKGVYYCYATGMEGIPVLTSVDLIQWEYCGYAFSVEDEFEYWAPCVVYDNGIFYLYYSSRNRNQIDCHYEFMKVAESYSPLGPFSYVKTLLNKFSIDPHVVKNEQNGWDMYYSVNDYCGCDSIRPGTVILCDHMIDGKTLQGNPRVAVLPTSDKEIFCNNRFGDGRNWHTVEGAFYCMINGNPYLMFSGNAFTEEKYFVGYATKDFQGNWAKYIDHRGEMALLKQKGNIEGVGHNSVVKAPNNIDNWIVYHGREKLREQNLDERRMMRMDHLLRDGEQLWTNGPTDTEQTTPHMPQIRSFYKADTQNIDVNWNVLEGAWKKQSDCCIQQEDKVIADLLSYSDYDNYLFEVNLCCMSDHKGCIYGAILAYLNSENYSKILLNTGRYSLVLLECVNGIVFETVLANIAYTIDFGYYHQIMIEKNGKYVSVYMDDVLIADANTLFGQGRVGLTTSYSKAAFAGITLTKTYHINEKNKHETIKKLICCTNNADKNVWQMKDGILSCYCQQESIIRYNEIMDGDFQFEIDFKLNRQNSRSTFGILLKSSDGEATVLFNLTDQEQQVSCVQNGTTVFSNLEVIKSDFSTVLLECTVDGIELFHFGNLYTMNIGNVKEIYMIGNGNVDLKNLRITHFKKDLC